MRLLYYYYYDIYNIILPGNIKILENQLIPSINIFSDIFLFINLFIYLFDLLIKNNIFRPFS